MSRTAFNTSEKRRGTPARPPARRNPSFSSPQTPNLTQIISCLSLSGERESFFHNIISISLLSSHDTEILVIPRLLIEGFPPQNSLSTSQILSHTETDSETETEMEKEDKDHRTLTMTRPPETEFFLQWGTRKRLRCVRIRSSSSPPHLFSHFSSDSSDPSSASRIRRKITSRFLSVANQDRQFSLPQSPCRLTRNSETAAVLRSENRRGSPEKEERSYTTRGSVSFGEENGKVNQPDVHGHGVSVGEENVNNNNHHRGGGGLIWPKLYIALSSKEKEEDFMAMKGCKLPQRPKKRAKVVQRTLLLVSPGAWLTDMSLERYEVREKKTTKKRPRGLKAMGSCSIDSDSD